MALKFGLNMLKWMFDELCSKSSQCENNIELEFKYIYLTRSVEHMNDFMLIMNIIYDYYVLNEDLLAVALYV